MGVVNETETQYQLGGVLRGPGRRWASAARAAAVAAAVLCSQAPWASADERMFTWSYEAKSLPQGTWEWEQWATLQDGKASGRWSTLNLADEIEYGITDRLTASVYLHTFYQGNSAVPGTPNDHEVGFRKMSSEWTYRLTDPSADAVGIMLYEEPEVSSTLLEFETKLVISKQIGPWTFAYNFTWEPELLRAADPHQSPQWTLEHEFWNTAGVSYGLT
ncbi:MAG TPA: hypothetical protein VEN81_17155, partial [Planctomycetota bacterium]|nr:hypothetical protein [Planctomycetota bacterium]